MEFLSTRCLTRASLVVDFKDSTEDPWNKSFITLHRKDCPRSPIPLVGFANNLAQMGA